MAKDRVLSTKRLQIDKANSSVVVILAIASFISVFSLVASRALLSQRSYQGRVIAEKRKALVQLKANNQAAKELVDSYKVFAGTPNNVIGGVSGGTGNKDGDNARIILDALPSKYDFPALATSLEKILTSNKFRLNAISGSDDELNQTNSKNTGVIAPIEIPFQIGISGDSESIKELIGILQVSIRPIRIGQLSMSGGDKELTVSLSAKTYYQPQKVINITTKVVK